MVRACSTYVGVQRSIEGFGGETWEKRKHLEERGVDGKIILRWIFRKWDVGAWNGSIWLRKGTGGGLL